MKQQVIKIVVTDENNVVKFEKCPCRPEDIMACLSLFGTTGVTISASIVELDIPVGSSKN